MDCDPRLRAVCRHFGARLRPIAGGGVYISVPRSWRKRAGLRGWRVRGTVSLHMLRDVAARLQCAHVATFGFEVEYE